MTPRQKKLILALAKGAAVQYECSMQVWSITGDVCEPRPEDMPDYQELEEMLEGVEG